MIFSYQSWISISLFTPKNSLGINWSLAWAFSSSFFLSFSLSLSLISQPRMSSKVLLKERTVDIDEYDIEKLSRTTLFPFNVESYIGRKGDSRQKSYLILHFVREFGIGRCLPKRLTCFSYLSIPEARPDST